MKIFAATAALVVVLAGSLLPAAARDSYVQDGASLLKPATVESLNRTIDDFHRQYGKEIVVVTVPSLDGQTINAVAEKTFAQLQVNGAMLLFAKTEKKDGVYVDRAARRFFPAGSTADIKSAMTGYLRSGDFDGGVSTGVNLIVDTYRSHAPRHPVGNVRAYQSAPATNAASTGGFNMSWIWLIAIAVIGFLIVRAIFRAIAGPRVPPAGYGGGMGGPMGGPGYGQGGYGYGGGPMGGGGGGFFSGLLGGLGGAFIGNELFGNRDRGFGGGEAGMGGGEGGSNDNSGFQNDAGQIDTGNSSSGDYGSGGGGWGDSGGGGGDFGGGGGDSGGGW